MLYCDLDINSTNAWSGVLCENRVLLNQPPYQSFIGSLYFYDTQGEEDPDYTGLGDGGRFQLIYNPTGVAADAQVVPLQQAPNQVITVALGNQNATITLYTRTATLTES